MPGLEKTIVSGFIASPGITYTWVVENDNLYTFSLAQAFYAWVRGTPNYNPFPKRPLQGPGGLNTWGMPSINCIIILHGQRIRVFH